MPRAASCLKPSQTLFAYEYGTVCSSSPYELLITCGKVSCASTYVSQSGTKGGDPPVDQDIKFSFELFSA
ncbi:hypothetical protein KCU78_g22, partial [Aureobasidium melanogenum]